MKFSINQKFKYSKTGRFIAVLAIMLSSIGLNAQYCTSGATSTTDEFITNVKIEQGSNVLLNNNSWQPSTTVCAQYTDYTGLTPVVMSAGATYTIKITNGYCGTGTFTNQALAWIDYNRNNTFEAAEAVRSTPFAGAAGIRDITYTFTVPCNINPGRTRLRCVLIETTTMANPTSACGTYTWGETEDYSIDLQLPSSLSASFNAPASAWVKAPIKFTNNNPNGYISHAWDANNDGTIEAPNSIDFTYTWTTPGSKCIKLTSTNCLGSDNSVKCLTVNTPTVVPTANFVTNKVTVEQYQFCQLFDLSSDGAYMWEWDVYDSTDVSDVKDINSGDVIPDPNNNGRDELSQNPEFAFDRPGCYTVVLISKNDIGSSTPKKKTCYITVISPTTYILGFGTYGPNGDNVVESPSGTIFDNGGANLNYSNNQGLGTRSFLRITPCNAKRIDLTMTRLKFNGPGDILRVWDGPNANGTLLATWTSTNRTPNKVSATSGSMYILFTSDATGVDSGFAGTYTSLLGPAVAPTPSFSPSSNPGYNSTPIKFTNNTTDIVGVPRWEWTIDDIPVSTSKDLNYIFTSDQDYKVCLEVKSCVGSNKTCMTYDVISPNTQTSLDFEASNRRPKILTDIISLVPTADKANRFEWTIYPTTYTLMNPPASPSAFGAGFIHYKATPGDSMPTPIIRFTGSGCYTIALKAWNSLDPTNTTKTVVKNKYVCALNYCNPTSAIISSDLGINNVKVLDGTNALIDNNSTSGVQAYTDFSNTQVANLTFGKTYTLEVSRLSNVDPGNRKAWIDWNIDGDFDDANELIFFEPSTTNKSYTTTFAVPDIKSAFEGNTRLRIGINFDNNNTDPCGPAVAGEYHDYGIVLYNDNSKPVITIIGETTKRIQLGSTYNDSGATAYDASEGDITSRILPTNDLDVNTTGIYSYEYNVTDKSGNVAATAIRTIIVVNDNTAPVIVLNPTTTGCIEANRENDPYNDPGATAYNTNPFYSLTTAIRTSGTVNTRLVGDYTIEYKVYDFAGNVATATRNICVRDTTAPEIKGIGETNIQIGTLWIDQTFATDGYDDNPQLHTSWFPEPLNPNVKGTYTCTYTAVDALGNVSKPEIVNYKVDDFIKPVISLNTFDVIEHPVNTPYNSIAATVTDNYYGAGQVSISRTFNNVDPNTLGSYTETFKAVDGSGNITIKSRTINVVDKQAPILFGGTIYGCVGENIWPKWNLTTTDNYYGPQTLLPLVEIIAQNVNPYQEGNYFITYKVTDPSGNTSLPLTRQVIYTYWPACVNSTVDVNSATINEVSISPNPTNGLANIQLANAVKNAKIQLYNSLGQMVSETNYNNPSANFNIDMTELASGVYSVNIVLEGRVITQKIVKY